MVDHKKTQASISTETRNIQDLSEKTGNIYQTVSIISKRAIQVNREVKEELLAKLEEFATPSESIDEIFENSEQIEVSKFYERLPKGTLISIQEWLEDKIYHRKVEEQA
ncbi:MAG: hypothetical protein CMP75_04475 [Flavobacteriales bacterium]|nr:hypothetical protein [Flavobacteriales bacterium]|tara:strand:+ start:573 stop:899 length:327 start_codon:yes stop_codon:yes gene_type:complete